MALSRNPLSPAHHAGTLCLAPEPPPHSLSLHCLLLSLCLTAPPPLLLSGHWSAQQARLLPSLLPAAASHLGPAAQAPAAAAHGKHRDCRQHREAAMIRCVHCSWHLSRRARYHLMLCHVFNIVLYRCWHHRMHSKVIGTKSFAELSPVMRFLEARSFAAHSWVLVPLALLSCSLSSLSLSAHH